MSVFSPVKAIIFTHLSTMPSDLRKATITVLNELDGDLEKGGYIPSSSAEEAFENFSDVLEGLDNVGEGDDEVPNSAGASDDPEDLFSDDDDEEDDDDIDYDDDEENDEDAPSSLEEDDD